MNLFLDFRYGNVHRFNTKRGRSGFAVVLHKGCGKDLTKGPALIDNHVLKLMPHISAQMPCQRGSSLFQLSKL